MANHGVSGSSVKLGLSVFWPAFWTGVPVKIIIVLLILAMGSHPWEMPGLAFLLVLSIPIDIWALNLAAKTVFLERLHLKPPDSVGLTLWWQGALMSAIYLPIAYFIESETIAGAKAVAGWIMEFLKELPVAEKISIELVLWASVASAVLLLLVLCWLFLFGRIVRGQTTAAATVEAPYLARVRQWDLMRVPADQPLLLTALTASGVMLVVLLWAFMPVTTPHPHEDYKKDAPKVAAPLKPVEALQKTEKLIGQAESAVTALEAKAEEENKEQGKAKGDKGAAKEPSPKGAGQKPGAAKPATKGAAEKAGLQAADGHQH